MTTQKFLAIAYHHNFISKKQAIKIFCEQKRLRKAISDKKETLIGHIGYMLGVFTENDIEYILEYKNTAERENVAYEDPITLYHKIKRGYATLSNRNIRLVISLLILFSVVLTFIITKDIYLAGSIASVASIIFVALPYIFSFPIKIHRIIHVACILILIIIIIVFSLQTYKWLIYKSQTISESYKSLFVQYHRLFLLLLIVALAFLFLSYWRHREIWFLETRISLTKSLIIKTKRKDDNISLGIDDKKKNDIQSILKSTAIIISMNPWVYSLKWLSRMKSKVGAISLWYLESNVDDKDTLSIVDFSCPGAPGEVINAFNYLKEKHNPVMLNMEEYKKRIKQSTYDGHLNAKEFRAIPDRNSFISACGFVYVMGQCISASDASRCLAYDSKFIDEFENNSISDEVKRWMNFKSFEACPVFKQYSNDDVVGVLIVFKNIQNGFTPEDRDSLIIGSNLLSEIVKEGCYAQR